MVRIVFERCKKIRGQISNQKPPSVFWGSQKNSVPRGPHLHFNPKNLKFQPTRCKEKVFPHLVPFLKGNVMAAIKLNINGTDHTIDVSPEMPLLWVLRDVIGMTGTKFSCGRGLCGSCTVHLDGEATRSCVTPVESVQGKRVVTIEGLAAAKKHPLFEAWIGEDVPQCGYCQPGQIMTAAALLDQKPNPTDADIDAAMAMTLCRCGTYPRIERAIKRAARKTVGQGGAR